MSTFKEGIELEEQQTKLAIDAAKKSNVSHLIYSYKLLLMNINNNKDMIIDDDDAGR